MIGRVAGSPGDSEGERGLPPRAPLRHCRAVLSDRRESNEWLAGLVPVALLGGQRSREPPTRRRVIAVVGAGREGATVRSGRWSTWRWSCRRSALAKVGAGTAAAVVAGAAALPLVTDAAAPNAPPAAPAAPVVAEATAAPAQATTVPSQPATPSRQARAHSQARRAASTARAADLARRRSAARPRVGGPRR